MLTSRSIFATTALTLALFGCGGTQTRPDDMSAEDHRTTADEHDEHAGQHEGQFDPDARDTRARAGAAYEFAEEIYNPTQFHQAEADREREHADEHRQAADALEAFEAEECGSFPPTTRATCPLLGQLSAVEDIDGGARLTFAEGANGDAIYAHVRCHIAFAGTQGREGMDHCPMYVQGVTAERDDSTAMLLRGEGEAAVTAIRARARAHLAP